MNNDTDLPKFKRILPPIEKIGEKTAKKEEEIAVIEKDKIIRWKRTYLQDIKTVRQQIRKIYYLDKMAECETYVK